MSPSTDIGTVLPTLRFNWNSITGCSESRSRPKGLPGLHNAVANEVFSSKEQVLS